MKVSDKIKELEESDNYFVVRVETSNEFIEMVKTMMPTHYERIREKEENYQYIIEEFKKLKEILK